MKSPNYCTYVNSMQLNTKMS